MRGVAEHVSLLEATPRRVNPSEAKRLETRYTDSLSEGIHILFICIPTFPVGPWAHLSYIYIYSVYGVDATYPV